MLCSLMSCNCQYWWPLYLNVVCSFQLQWYDVGCGCWCVRMCCMMELSARCDDLRDTPLLLTVGPFLPYLHFLHESMAWSHGLWVWNWDEGRKGWWLVAAGAAAAGARARSGNGGWGWVWYLNYELFVGSTSEWWGGWLAGQNPLVNSLDFLSLLSNEETMIKR